MSRPTGMLIRHTALLLACAPLGACVMGPDFVAPTQAAGPEGFAAGGDDLLTADPIRADWWESFGDPTLSALETRAIADNLDLQTAEARIAGSRAQLRIAGASGLPVVNGGASYFRERASPKGIQSLSGADGVPVDAAGGTVPQGATGRRGGGNSPSYDLFQVGFDASWEIDLWGKARRTREAARADARAAVFDGQAIRVSITAEVARVYTTLRGAEAKLEVVEKNRETIQRALTIAARREEEGAATRYDTATAAAQLSSIDALTPTLRLQIRTARNALALLVAAPPRALDELLEQPASIPVLPAEVPTGLPSELARRRPDIAAAEASLHAATARIGAAKANFYPSISLAGSFGTQAIDIADVPGWAARQFVLGPILRLPIFQGGRLKGQLELTRADQQAAAIRYRATVLRSWHEVDDALTAFRTELERTKALGRATDQSRVAVTVAEKRYRAGATGFLPVLIAERSLLANEAELSDSRTASAAAMVALYKALGGGWTPPTQPVRP